MIFRDAVTRDIPELHRVRMSVKENVLHNPALVTEADYYAFLTSKGKGWLCEMDNIVAGFAILDLNKKNVWALFVHPAHEKKGIGKKLHKMMLDWFFTRHDEKLWLTTGKGTRAESFYKKAGWQEKGWATSGELLLEIFKKDWLIQASSRDKAH